MAEEKEAVPEKEPGSLVQEYFPVVRRIVVFLLGCAVIIDALWDRQYVVPELIVGMILVGVLPISDFMEGYTKKRRV